MNARTRSAIEDFSPRYPYPRAYQPERLADQVARLREHFPWLHTGDEDLTNRPLPSGAEGWFAIPCWDALALTYTNAVHRVLAKLSEMRMGAFRIDRALALRRRERRVEMLDKIGDQQRKHDILVIPAQFGLRHKGRSVSRARHIIDQTPNEFALGAFEVGIMLLTHPERLQHYGNLWIDCAGDDDTSIGDDGFARAPCFYFRDGQPEFGVRWLGDAYGHYGSASAFLPE